MKTLLKFDSNVTKGSAIKAAVAGLLPVLEQNLNGTVTVLLLKCELLSKYTIYLSLISYCSLMATKSTQIQLEYVYSEQPDTTGSTPRGDGIF